MKKSKKAIIIIIIVIVLVLVTLVFLNFPKPVKTSDKAFRLGQIEDGSYVGSCDNGLVKAQVEVVVQNHAIIEVKILDHDNGMGGAAETITNSVVKYQSVEVDSIAGATISSKTILKAVENALSKK